MASIPQIHEVGVRDIVFGKNFRCINPCNLYGVIFGDDVFVGPFTEIQNDVRIGSRVKIQSHTFICSLVTIGDDCFVGHGVAFVNDKFSTGLPARGDRTKWQSTNVGHSVQIGSNATILPVTICNNVVIGAGSVVSKSIKYSGVYAGNPAKFIRTL